MRSLSCTAFLLVAVVCVSASGPSGFSLSGTFLCLSTLSTLNVQVHGFFGFFRRRSRPTPVPVTVSDNRQDMAFEPSGPVSAPFFRRQSSFFSNPFSSANSFMPAFTQRQWPMDMQMSYQQQVAQQMKDQDIPQNVRDQVFLQMQQEQQRAEDHLDFRPGRSEELSPSLNPDEAESFFTLLAETDESLCISRLVCEMGADPMTGGEFGQTIVEIIGNLRNFPDGSKVSYFNEVLQTGLSLGLDACSSRFSSCDNESLQMVKNAQASDS